MIMKIFDSHCHLDDNRFNADLDDVIDRAHKAQVNAIMIAGINLETSQKAVRIANSHKNIYTSVGVHPHDVKNCHVNIIDRLKRLSREPKVMAWGEIGLDFNRMYASKEIQENWFIQQLQTADELGLPLIFHERESQGRLIELLKRYPYPHRKAVVHCFSGTENELKAYLEMGFYIGVTGIITIKKRGQALRRMAPMIPAERLLVETDAPYLTPAPHKNKTRRNEPAFVRSVLLTLSRVRQEDPEGLANIIWNNTCKLFDISS
jgi:TatD DNase family protein